jgi:hypothetical protein
MTLTLFKYVAPSVILIQISGKHFKNPKAVGIPARAAHPITPAMSDHCYWVCREHVLNCCDKLESSGDHFTSRVLEWSEGLNTGSFFFSKYICIYFTTIGTENLK